VGVLQCEEGVFALWRDWKHYLKRENIGFLNLKEAQKNHGMITMACISKRAFRNGVAREILKLEAKVTLVFTKHCVKWSKLQKSQLRTFGPRLRTFASVSDMQIWVFFNYKKGVFGLGLHFERFWCIDYVLTTILAIKIRFWFPGIGYKHNCWMSNPIIHFLLHFRALSFMCRQN
jgi:hypothetical protein